MWQMVICAVEKTKAEKMDREYWGQWLLLLFKGLPDSTDVHFPLLTLSCKAQSRYSPNKD